MRPYKPWTIVLLTIVILVVPLTPVGVLVSSQGVPQPLITGVSPSSLEGYQVEMAFLNLTVYNNGTNGTIFVSVNTDNTVLYYVEVNISENEEINLSAPINLTLLQPGNHNLTVETGPAGGGATDNTTVPLIVYPLPPASVQTHNIYVINPLQGDTLPISANLSGGPGNYTVQLIRGGIAIATWELNRTSNWSETLSFSYTMPSMPPLNDTFQWTVLLHLYNGSLYQLSSSEQELVAGTVNIMLPEPPLLSTGQNYSYSFQVNVQLPPGFTSLPATLSYTAGDSAGTTTLTLSQGSNPIAIPLQTPTTPTTGNISVNISATHGWTSNTLLFTVGSVALVNTSFSPTAPATGVGFHANTTITVDSPPGQNTTLYIRIAILDWSSQEIWTTTLTLDINGPGTYTMSTWVPGLSVVPGTYDFIVYHAVAEPISGENLSLGTTPLNIVYPSILDAIASPGPAGGVSNLTATLGLVGNSPSTFNITVYWNGTLMGGPVETVLSPNTQVNATIEFNLPPEPGVKTVTLVISQAGTVVTSEDVIVNVTGGIIAAEPNPFYVLTGKPFQVNATLTNTGPLMTTFSVLVYIDGVHSTTWTTTLEPGGEEVLQLPFDGYNVPGSHNITYLVNVQGVTVYRLEQTIYAVSVSAYMEPAENAVPHWAGVAGELLYLTVDSPVPVNLSIRGGLNDTVYLTVEPGVEVEIYLLFPAANESGSYTVSANVSLFDGRKYVDAVSASSIYNVYILSLEGVSVSPLPAVAGGTYTVSLNASLDSPVPVAFNYTVSVAGYEFSSSTLLIPGTNLVVGVMEAPSSPGSYPGVFTLTRVMSCCTDNVSQEFTVDVASASIASISPGYITSYPYEVWTVNMTIQLDASVPMNGQLLLSVNDALVGAWNGTLSPGNNFINIPFTVPGSGQYYLQVKVILAGVVQGTDTVYLNVIPYPSPSIEASLPHTYYQEGSTVQVNISIENQVSPGDYLVEASLAGYSVEDTLSLAAGASGSSQLVLPAPELTGPSQIEIQVYLQLFNGSLLEVYSANLSIWVYSLSTSLSYQPIVRFGDTVEIAYNVTLNCPCTTGVPAVISGNITTTTALRSGANIFEYTTTSLEPGYHLFTINLSIDGVVVDYRVVNITVVRAYVSAMDAYSLPGGQVLLPVNYTIEPSGLEASLAVSIPETGSTYTFEAGTPIQFQAPAGINDYLVNVTVTVGNVPVNYTLTFLHVVNARIANISVSPQPAPCNSTAIVDVGLLNPSNTPLTVYIILGTQNLSIGLEPGYHEISIPITLGCTQEQLIPVKLYLLGSMVDSATTSVRMVNAEIISVLTNQTNGYTIITVIVQDKLGGGTFNITVSPSWSTLNWTVVSLNPGARTEVSFVYQPASSPGNYTVSVALYSGSLLLDSTSLAVEFQGNATNQTQPPPGGNVTQNQTNTTNQTPGGGGTHGEGGGGITIGGGEGGGGKTGKILALVVISVGLAVGGALGYLAWKRRRTGVVVEF